MLHLKSNPSKKMKNDYIHLSISISLGSYNKCIIHMIVHKEFKLTFHQPPYKILQCELALNDSVALLAIEDHN